MYPGALVTLNMRELDRLKVNRAAERLKLTTRQIRRLVARLRKHGAAGLVSGHRAKPGNK